MTALPPAASLNGQATAPDAASESFRAIDLRPVLAGTFSQPLPTILTWHGDGASNALLYAGAINGVHGDSGAGKSWAAVLALAERIKQDEHVMLIDLEDAPGSIVQRLRMCGVSDDAIARQLAYVHPDDEFGDLEVDLLLAQVAERAITLVVIDSLGEAFGLEGVNENNDNEVGPWLRRVPRRLAEAGPAVLLIDHSTKSQERQLHPSGSKRKRAAIGGASYLIEEVTPFVQGGSGRLRVICAKDRHGTYRRGEHVAWLDLTTHPDSSVTLELVKAPPPRERKADKTTRELILEALKPGDEFSTRASTAKVRETAHGYDQKLGDQPIRDELELLAVEGKLTKQSGARGAVVWGRPRGQT